MTDYLIQPATEEEVVDKVTRLSILTARLIRTFILLGLLAGSAWFATFMLRGMLRSIG